MIVVARRVAAAIGVVLLVVTAGCGSPKGAVESRRRQLLQVALPDLSPMSASVRAQITDRHEALTTLARGQAAPSEALGEAYGEVGSLLMAVRFQASAEPYFLNAESLQAGDMRWPYMLGQLYQATGDLDKSAAAYERALRLSPNDVPTLFSLSDARLAQNRPEAAAPLLEKARSLQPRLGAVHYGLGRVALARQDYREAAARLEEALRVEPQATTVHYPLALAYRGLGDTARAEAHLKQRGETAPALPDPIMTAQMAVLNSSKSYEMRAMRALQAGDASAAEESLRLAVDLAPSDPSPRHGLGAARMATGDVRGALREFDAALKLSPTFAAAHYSRGMLMAMAGRDREAIANLSSAVKYKPDDAAAQLGLADLLRRTGRVLASLASYQKALAIDSRLREARFGYAIGLVRLGRYGDAAESLAEGMTLYPDQPEFALALARVLATAPEEGVRDGARALSIVTKLAEARSGSGVEVGETMAMAMAEVGRFAEASRVQRELIARLEGDGEVDLAREFRENLRRYERGEPCRIPWPADAPIHYPGPEPDPAIAKMLASG